MVWWRAARGRSGILPRHPQLKIALSEGQVGWMPFMLERADSLWERGDAFERGGCARISEPAEQLREGSDLGLSLRRHPRLASREAIGMSQTMCEVGYPHADSTFPHTLLTAEKLFMTSNLTDHEAWQLLRGNVFDCYGLQRFGGSN